MPTKIEWCDETFNPWWGCERVSPGCAHCYAATFSRRLGMDHLWRRRPSVQNGQEHGFRFFGDEHWAQPLKWARTLPAKLGRRPRIFCASMADVFEERDELLEPRRRLFDLIAETPELDWLILTKRPEYARDLFVAWQRHPDADPDLLPLPNVWMGVSIETARQTYRADVLRQIPAAVRFISAEPLLGSLYHSPNGLLPRIEFTAADSKYRRLDLTGIDWLIIGGESGPRARPCDLRHVRELVEACKSRRYVDAAPAIFVKQLGTKPVDGQSHYVDDPRAGGWEWSLPLHLRDAKGGDWNEWPDDLRIREWPSVVSRRVPEAA